MRSGRSLGLRVCVGIDSFVLNLFDRAKLLYLCTHKLFTIAQS